MDREQIIQMAREAGFTQIGMCETSGGGVEPGNVPFFACHPAIIEAFASAIRAATKEEDAKICESVCEKIEGKLPGWIEIAADAIRASK